MSGIKFIKAEYDNNRMLYFWECSMCGKTFTTKKTNNLCGLCSECKKKEWERRTKENKEKAERRTYKKIVAKLKKAEFPYKDIQSITVNGEKYYKASEIEDAISTMLDKHTNTGKDGETWTFPTNA